MDDDNEWFLTPRKKVLEAGKEKRKKLLENLDTDEITEADACRIVKCQPAQAVLSKLLDNIGEEYRGKKIDKNSAKKVLIDLEKREFALRKKNSARSRYVPSTSPMAIVGTALYLSTNLSQRDLDKIADSDGFSITIRSTMKKLFPKTLEEVSDDQTAYARLKYQIVNEIHPDIIQKKAQLASATSQDEIVQRQTELDEIIQSLKTKQRILLTKEKIISETPDLDKEVEKLRDERRLLDANIETLQKHNTPSTDETNEKLSKIQELKQKRNFIDRAINHETAERRRLRTKWAESEASEDDKQ